MLFTKMRCKTRLLAWKQPALPSYPTAKQTKSSFATYPLTNLSNIAADGITIPLKTGTPANCLVDGWPV